MAKLVLFILVCLLGVPAGGQIPRTFSYQGVLADSLGNPKPDGTYSFTFRLYDVSSGGTPLWSEQKTLAVRRGLFHTILGDQVVIGSDITFNRPYWLGILVGIGSEMTPRIPLTAVAQSLSSAIADSARRAARADTATFALAAPPQGVVDSARIAGTVPNNSITGAKVVDGSLMRGDVAPNQLVTAVNGVRDDVAIVSQNGVSVLTYNDTIRIGFSIPYSGVAASIPSLMSLSNTWQGATAPTFKSSSASSYAPAASFFKGSGTTTSASPAVQAENFTSIGEAMWLRNTVSSNPYPVVKLHLPASPTAHFVEGVIWNGITAPVRRFHITSAGTFVAGSDFAEAFTAEGGKDLYEPGDVLVLAGGEGKTVAKSTRAYDQTVVGIYSTRPGVLGADKDGVTRLDPDDIPVAITGIVPTKVTNENGAIQPGDLLTTSSTPGYAMKASPSLVNGVPIYPAGTILGKSLESLNGNSGIVRVLIMAR